MKSIGNIIIYQTSDGTTNIDVRIENETVWLNQYQLSELFQTDRTSIVKHIKNVFDTGELEEKATCAKFAQVQKEGNRNVKRDIIYYNLDLIISVGYRVQSHVATHFRIWATQRLKEYIIKGFTMDDERLKAAGQISHQLAIEIAESEYEKFNKSRIISEDLNALESLNKEIKKLKKN